jgi:hypothetical protein
VILSTFSRPRIHLAGAGYFQRLHAEQGITIHEPQEAEYK